MADLEHIPLWRRFHIRLTGLYSTGVLLVLLGTGWAFFTLGFRITLQGLQDRILARVNLLALTLDAGALQALDEPQDKDLPIHGQTMALFDAIAEQDPDISSIYVALRTEREGRFALAVDWNRDGYAAPVGGFYEASSLAGMIDALERPVVEQEVIADLYGSSLSGYAPLRRADGVVVGVVGIDIDAAHIEQIRREMLLICAMLYGIAILLLLLISYVAGRDVRKPLERVVRATEDVARGVLHTRIGLDRADEFGVLSERFDEMAAGLEEREQLRQIFGRFVSEEVAEALLHRQTTLTGEEREVTVLFADMQSYSTLVEHLSPAQVVELLNGFLTAMHTVVDKYEGCILEIPGDGLLAVFNAPLRINHHPSQAVRCAFAMQEALQALNRQWDQRGLTRAWQEWGIHHLRMRIGIHTGSVIAGAIGSPNRMKYAVIGDTVNVAARLEALNKAFGTEILVSGAVVHQLPPELQALLRPEGVHKVKGREQTVEVFAVDALTTGG